MTGAIFQWHNSFNIVFIGFAPNPASVEFRPEQKLTKSSSPHEKHKFSHEQAIHYLIITTNNLYIYLHSHKEC